MTMIMVGRKPLSDDEYLKRMFISLNLPQELRDDMELCDIIRAWPHFSEERKNMIAALAAVAAGEASLGQHLLIAWCDFKDLIRRALRG